MKILSKLFSPQQHSLIEDSTPNSLIEDLREQKIFTLKKSRWILTYFLKNHEIILFKCLNRQINCWNSCRYFLSIIKQYSRTWWNQSKREFVTLLRSIWNLDPTVKLSICSTTKPFTKYSKITQELLIKMQLKGMDADAFPPEDSDSCINCLTYGLSLTTATSNKNT